MSLLSDEQIQQTLRFMGRAAGVPLNQEVAREVCQRNQSKAMLAGSISAVGAEYLLGIEALDCQSGKSLVHVGANAASKEKVLQALGQAASELRAKLGESLALVGTPEVGATWAVNEALREAEFGNSPEARHAAASAIQLSPGGRYVPGIAALALARAGDTAQAQKIAAPWPETFPRTPS